MAEHTPGPWEVGSVFPGGSMYDAPIVQAKTNHHIADIYRSGYTVEFAANERLIAAAPDMYAALEAQAAADAHISRCPQCNDYRLSGDRCVEWGNLSMTAGKLREAAIAKAKGGNQ